MEDGRLNTPTTSAVTLEVLGHRLFLSQDPNSKHLGTTVWDASMVLIKFLMYHLHRVNSQDVLSYGLTNVEKEKNCRKGRFCPSKLRGKRAIELGAGCGLAGFGLALLGCQVVSTDQVEVLPLLMKNVERNTSWIRQANTDSAEFVSIEVAELDWGNEDHIKAVGPPFDFIIGTDVVYSEHLLEPLLHTILALSGPRTTILLGYEIRSTTVHEQMIRMWKDNFLVKSVPRAKMDIKYQHPSIQLFIMEQKSKVRCGENISNATHLPEPNHASDDEERESCGVDDKEDVVEMEVAGGYQSDTENGKMDDWEVRRHGSMAARLLKDVKLI